MRQQIYTVTAFSKAELNEISNFPDIGERRYMGFYHTFFEAENAVLENFNDIYEGMYKYVIIEEMDPGIKQKDTNRKLYEWDGVQYNHIEFIGILKKLSNFSFG